MSCSQTMSDAKSASVCAATPAPTETPADDKLAGPPPPPYHNSTWSLISQGAEARLWRIPHYITTTTAAATTSTAAACKERFPKSYRHPTLDATLTRSRTRAEARCLVRCRRGGVPCPAVLGVDSGRDNKGKDDSRSNKPSSSCLFLEWIDGCTVRQYLEERAHYPEDEADFAVDRDSDDEIANNNKEDEEEKDNSRVNVDGGPDASNGEPPRKKAKTMGSAAKVTRVDDHALAVARAVGILVADMHNVNIVHGDLTTSNVMMRNPPSSTPLDDNDGDGDEGKEDTNDSSTSKADPANEPTAATTSTGTGASNSSKERWEPHLVMIDFGLASMAGSKGVSHEEKAVDLYVLERAFESTHPGSSDLVAEIHRAYKGRCKTSDRVLQRLSQVRLRGRKRECFG